MKKQLKTAITFICLIVFMVPELGCNYSTEAAVSTQDTQIDELKTETPEDFNQRMAWWREGRFGMFIHWGLYAIPAGQWKDETHHAEWILTTAKIPVSEYEKFAPQFNPVKFNASEWVRMAKEAGMKYIVITSKHHDGFCLYDSNATDYDVIDAAPFKRDILKELTDECNKQGIRMCFYYSIMDWHHPDYLPRRKWENRSAEGADFNRYVDYMTKQVTELVNRYDPHVLWFDGQWESTWSHEEGVKLYNHLRNLKPDIIINNRVDVGEISSHNTGKFAGDYGTPEQKIPATGIKGFDWETCMTMNDHWGWNKIDKNFKSTEKLIHMLVDIASKGGNFLLNVGPKADGTFPQESIDRLAAIGQWMKTNGDSIYGTSASRFENLEWGRSTTKGNTIYLHVFNWPKDNKLVVPGLITKATNVYPIAASDQQLAVEYSLDSATITLPSAAIDPIDTVIVMEFSQAPEIISTPEIMGSQQFYPDCDVEINCGSDNVLIYYTIDGSEPTQQSLKYTGPFNLTETTTIKCRVFRDGKPVTPITTKIFTRLTPKKAKTGLDLKPGLTYDIYHGKWDKMPDYKTLKPVKSGVCKTIDITVRDINEYLSIVFEGYITVDQEGLYTFSLDSDDGSKLYIDDEVVVDNDGLHPPTTKQGSIALKPGIHSIRVEFFQGNGGIVLDTTYTLPDSSTKDIPADVLFHTPETEK